MKRAKELGFENDESDLKSRYIERVMKREESEENVNNKRRRRGRWVLVWVSVSASVAFSTEKDTAGIWSKHWTNLFSLTQKYFLLSFLPKIIWSNIMDLLLVVDGHILNYIIHKLKKNYK